MQFAKVTLAGKHFHLLKKTFVNKIYKAAVMIVVMEINWLYCHLIPTPHKKKLHQISPNGVIIQVVIRL